MNRESARLQKNAVGYYLKRYREQRGYSQSEVCDGICSITTLSRIEAGEDIVSFPMIEAIMSRMGIDGLECEFFITGEEESAYECQEEIKILFGREEYEKAEECLAVYEQKYGMKDIYSQFLFFWRAILEKNRLDPDKKLIKELLVKSIEKTVADYRKKIEGKELLSSIELDCIMELINCEENSEDREQWYEDFYAYFKWKQRKGKIFSVAYRKLLRYYAVCLYENEKYDQCILICDEVIKEMYSTSKEENRWYLFYIRAKAREGRELKSEEEKKLCLEDFLTAYHLVAFYNGEEKAETLKKYIEEKYRWQFIN